MITTKPIDDPLLNKFWDLNKKYPDFMHAVNFDHASDPQHDIEICKKIFMLKLNAALEKCLKDITLKIEDAEEDGNDELRKQLLAQRKQLKTLANIDLSRVETVDDLIAMKPDQLLPFWGEIIWLFQ